MRSGRLATQSGAKTAIGGVDLLTGRYSEIEEMANSIVAAQKLGPRIVRDTLAGLGRSSGDPKLAALLIVLWLDNCRSITSISLALSAALPLPEQIFRIWGILDDGGGGGVLTTNRPLAGTRGCCHLG